VWTLIRALDARFGATLPWDSEAWTLINYDHSERIGLRVFILKIGSLGVLKTRTHSERILVYLQILRTRSERLKDAYPYLRVQGYLAYKKPTPRRTLQ